MTSAGEHCSQKKSRHGLNFPFVTARHSTKRNISSIGETIIILSIVLSTYLRNPIPFMLLPSFALKDLTTKRFAETRDRTRDL